MTITDYSLHKPIALITFENREFLIETSFSDDVFLRGWLNEDTKDTSQRLT